MTVRKSRKLKDHDCMSFFTFGTHVLESEKGFSHNMISFFGIYELSSSTLNHRVICRSPPFPSLWSAFVTLLFPRIWCPLFFTLGIHHLPLSQPYLPLSQCISHCQTKDCRIQNRFLGSNSGNPPPSSLTMYLSLPNKGLSRGPQEVWILSS